MSRLFLFRHGKAAWAEPGMRDFDRKLDERGREEARAMGHLMKRRGLVPDRVICSTAVRAVETLDAINPSLHLEDVTTYEQNLYATDAPGYLEIASATDFDGDVMLVGHNPMLEDAALALSADGDEASLEHLHMGFRTAGLAIIRFDGPTSTFATDTGYLEAYLTPADA
ncbi:SixA phosphatase family protein [Oricola thermophila]|uniref:Histidine phosphatase family protein n=1 Tax=Oricola thermophila TaxID=2742145 RepID=A0A6N1VAY0_9HYPH|nr:histidine phosphatase family protein [Oricola thermophila]QKV17683.1 histidine phosphatase family protein [Oricola thermophila]